LTKHQTSAAGPVGKQTEHHHSCCNTAEDKQTTPALHNCTTFTAQHINKPAAIQKPFAAITVITVEPVNILQISRTGTVTMIQKFLMASKQFHILTALPLQTV
jgi:hypothetical protein